MNISRKLAVVAVGACVTLGTATAPAFANTAPASNEKTQYLSDNPAGDSQSCVSRDITLVAGSYQWQQVLGGTAINYRNIALKAGTYKWETCIIPTYEGSTEPYIYVDQSWLTPPSGSTAELDCDFELSTSGTYTWGDALVPISN